MMPTQPQAVSGETASLLAARDPEALIRYVPYMAYLGLQIDRTADEDGLLNVRLPFREDLVGNVMLPAIHGGVLGGFMEATALLQIAISEDSSRLPKTVDMTVSYLRPAKPQDCHSRCRVLRQGRRTATALVECWQEDRQRLICSAQLHVLLQADGRPLDSG